MTNKYETTTMNTDNNAKNVIEGSLVTGGQEHFYLESQAAIAEVLTAMDAELAVLERRLGKTRGLKQAMMQELLTGRTRLV